MPITRQSSKVENMSEDPVMITLKSIQEQNSNMNDSIQNLTEKVIKLQSEFDIIKDLKSSIEFTQANVLDLENKVSGIDNTVTSQNDRLDIIERKLENSQKQNIVLNEKLLARETYSRRENLKFVGISESNNETREQLIIKLRNMFSSKLKIADTDRILFQRCHRLGKKSENGTRDIIARFVYFSDREKVWNSRSELTGTDIIINEDFPEEIEHRRSVLYKVFKLARQAGYRVKFTADKLIINGSLYTVDSLDKLPPELHPKVLSEKHTDNSVLFYGGFSVFSNFYPCHFVYNGIKFNSVEQCFQYQKVMTTRDKKLADQILCEKDPKQQYYLAKNVKPDEANWNEQTSKEVMKSVVKAKFEQNPTLKSDLLKTDDKVIIECNPHNHFWANGLRLTDEGAEVSTNWKGQNVLGSILCSVREIMK